MQGHDTNIQSTSSRGKNWETRDILKTMFPVSPNLMKDINLWIYDPMQD